MIRVLLYDTAHSPVIGEFLAVLLQEQRDAGAASLTLAIMTLPVVIVSRDELGTINHTLLTVESLRAHAIPVRGVARLIPDFYRSDHWPFWRRGFPAVMLSDSANFVGFYDNYGVEVRVAYNWRDAFINGNGQSNTGPSEPTFTDEYAQWDLAVNWWFTDNLQIFGDVINATDETTYTFGREQNQVLFATQLGRRYNVGLRYKF